MNDIIRTDGQALDLGLRRHSSVALTAALYLAVAVVGAELYWNATAEFDRATLADLAAFQAEAPFQHRVLVPALVRAASVVLPISQPKLYQLTTVAALWLLLVAFRELCATAIGTRRGALLILLPLAANYALLNTLRLPYDLPAVLMFTLGLLAIVRRADAWFYAALIVGMLNRETAAFLVPAWLAVNFGQRGLGKLAAHAAAQGGIVLAVKVAIVAALGASGSGVAEWQLATNASHSDQLLGLWRLFGGLYLLVPLGWLYAGRDLRRIAIAAAPILCVLPLTAVLWETRVYSELVPTVTLLAIVALTVHTDSHRLNHPRRRLG